MTDQPMTMTIRDHWWFYVEKDASLGLGALPEKEERVVPNPKDEYVGLTRAINQVTGERHKWAPFNVVDRDRLEATYLTDPEAGEMAVSGHSGQRLWLANVGRKTMAPLYWKGGRQVALRRSRWFIMGLEEERDGSSSSGGIPCPSSWEVVLEAAIQANWHWVAPSMDLDESDLIVDLTGCLSVYQMCLKRAVSTLVTLIPRPPAPGEAAKGSSFVQGILPVSLPKPIRLIRGYPSYHGAVITALNHPANALGPKAPPEKAPTAPPSPFGPPIGDPEVIKDLVLVIHGIGQKLADKVGYGFVTAVNALRRNTLRVTQQTQGLGLEDLYILPIQWRVDLDMGSGYFAPPTTAKGASEFDNLMRSITLPSVPVVRTLATDVTMDVLLYMTPRHFDRILEACVREIRRVHGLFRRWNPTADPSVTLVGHSLGSALVYDLISSQFDPDQMAKEDALEQVVHAAHNATGRLGFSVDTFVGLGSPLPLFLLLKHVKPIACTLGPTSLLSDAIEHAKQGREDIGSQGLPPRFGFMHCRQYYNLFMPHDPVAYRMEPLVIPPEHLEAHASTPLLVPYCKGGVTGLKLELTERVVRTRQVIDEAFNRSFQSLPGWLRFAGASPKVVPRRPEDELEDAKEVPAPAIPYPASLLYHFNTEGRLDYSLQGSILESAYLSSISSHFSYWSDEDVAAFLVRQLTGQQRIR